MGRHKMHPDDVNARDWEFMLSERFPKVYEMQLGYAWVEKGLDWLSPARKDAVGRARAALVNAWPNELEGETLAPFVERLEKAFEPSNKPAVSVDLRGELENQRIEERGHRLTKAMFEAHVGAAEAHATHILWGGETVTVDHHPYGTEPDGLITQVRVEHERYYRDNGIQMPSAQQRHDEAEAEARKRWSHLFSGGLPPRERTPSKEAKLATLKLRLRRSCDRFGALDIQVEPVERDGEVGVQLCRLGSSERSTVMTLTEAEMWLDYFEKDQYSDVIKTSEQEIRSLFVIPETYFPL